MELATLTDATRVPGTEAYYLYHIYIIVLLLLIIVLAVLFRAMLRSMYKELSNRKDL